MILLTMKGAMTEEVGKRVLFFTSSNKAPL